MVVSHCMGRTSASSCLVKSSASSYSLSCLPRAVRWLIMLSVAVIGIPRNRIGASLADYRHNLYADDSITTLPLLDSALYFGITLTMPNPAI